MHYFEEIAMNDLFSLHVVGNKSKDEGLLLAKQSCSATHKLDSILTKYFTEPFKSNEYYNLFHEADISLNEVYTYASAIFDDPTQLHKQSINLAKHLYEKSVHPKVKGGEFYVVYFTGCVIGSETVDAIGIFKSENKDIFLNVFSEDENFGIESHEGINVKKLDKGALIFNTEQENGYILAVVDNTNRGAEAHYWMDEFLRLRQHQDEYYNTENALSMCKKFVTKELPEQFDISKADQVDLLNKSVKFFKDNDTFNIDDFTNEVIEQPDVIASFGKFRETYEQERDIEILDSFSISDTAVKKQARSFKSVIKLDKNFHIYVHGDRQMIEQGEDIKGKFYKVYYKEET